MPRKLKLEYVRSRIPVCYRHKLFIRWFMILISFAIMVYSIYFMIRFVNSDTPIFFKILPIVIAFVGLDSLLKKLTSLNSFTFQQDHIKLGFLAKKAILIPYSSIVTLELYRKITFYFGLTYVDERGRQQRYITLASFPHTLEILLNLADMAPQAQIPEQMQGMLDYLKESTTDEV